MNKTEQLKAVESSLLGQQICPELAAQATQLVFGQGSVDAEVLFIGEAPGKKEDEQGQPFVGASGKFLDAMLEEAGMSRDDVYITNIVKYRPPNNRDPSPAEKAAFLPFLLQQIAIIQPKLVITLGRHSMEYFLPGVKISDIHGQPLEVNVEGYAFRVMPLYHPAAALYNGSLRQTLIDDFRRVPVLLKTLHLAN